MAISQSTVVMDDGTVKIQITVPFIAPLAPQAGCLTTIPIMRNLTATVSTTGGTLAGGHNYYFQLVAIDTNGVLSAASEMIEVVVPSGTNTNEIVLSGVNPFDANAIDYQMYRAQDSPLTAQLIFAGAVPGTSPFTFTDAGFTTTATLPPSETIESTIVNWRVTGTSAWNFGAQTQDNTQTSLAFLIPQNIGGQSIDLQLLNVSINGDLTPSVLASIATYVVTSTYPTALNIAGAPNGNPVSITVKGAIPPTLPQGIFTYTSTTTSITISWASFSVLRADGTTTSVGSGNITISSLTAGTSYNFYPYYDEFAGTVNWTTGGTGSPAVAFTTNSASAAQMQNLQGYMPLSNGPITAATPASGTGGGGTGGGGTHICVRWGMKVETKERGVVEIQTVEEGESVSCLHRDGRWTRVVRKRIVPMESFVRVETRRGLAVQVTPTHEIITVNNEDGVPAARLCLNDILYVNDGLDHPGEVKFVNAQRGAKDSAKVQLSCEPTHMFFAGEMGPDILVHNFVPTS